ncbi:MAG: hypothetical protein EZS28_037481 [Streblomastix strix]|uniref:Uncharacterized protein n=1 Tax=Streblomastix strix TaxID=222440 RepID=A0A5J4UA02_9EUKA|nr:MAG: hypothetical protein EZS28_037481 [Streblomastix strix]
MVAICKDSQKLLKTSICAREQAIVESNSLIVQCIANSVTVSLLESIVQGMLHCGVFIDISVAELDAKAQIETVPPTATLFLSNSI